MEATATMRNWYIVGGTVAVLAGVLVLAFMFGPMVMNTVQSTNTQKITNQALINKTVFGFVGAPTKDDYDNVRIQGYMDNLGTKTVAKVNLEIQLFDDKGNRKEIVKYTISDIAPKTRKTFTANAGVFVAPRTSKARVVSIEVAR
jgi:hypothetical protein